MVTRKTNPYPPKAVKFYFDEKIPRRPADRRSRPVRGATAATARLAVEELLCRHHGATATSVRKLTPAAQKILFRIVTDPADRDHVYRRDAVSALATLGSHDAIMLLAALAADEKEDPVIAGRALSGLAELGGDAAVALIKRSLEAHPDEYVRNCALRALLKLKHRTSVPTLLRVAQTHPSPILRDRVRSRLAEMGVTVKGKRVPTRNRGVLQRDSKD
jgi:HEAT repeat protein